MKPTIEQLDDSQHKYLQIKQALLEYIVTLEPGSKLLSERKLAVQVGCNVLTVRKAMLMLVEQGVIVRRSGSGTYVSDEAGRILGGLGLDGSAQSQQASSSGQKRLGLLIHARSDSYAMRLIAALQRKTTENGVALCCRMVSDLGDAMVEELSILADEGCGAAILPWYPHDCNAEVAQTILKSRIPLVIPLALPGFEQYTFEKPECFGQNLIKGCESLGGYFTAAGYTNIAFLGPDNTASEILQKNLTGYSSYVCRVGLQNIVGLVGESSGAMDDLAEKWAAYSPDFAVISYDDDHALRFMTSMHKLGKVAPDDFALVSFGNSAVSLLSDPPMSCVFSDYEHTAYWMIANAFALSEGKVAQAEQEPELKFSLRRSCGGAVRLGSKLDSVLDSLGLQQSMSSEDTRFSGVGSVV